MAQKKIICIKTNGQTMLKKYINNKFLQFLTYLMEKNIDLINRLSNKRKKWGKYIENKWINGRKKLRIQMILLIISLITMMRMIEYKNYFIISKPGLPLTLKLKLNYICSVFLNVSFVHFFLRMLFMNFFRFFYF